MPRISISPFFNAIDCSSFRRTPICTALFQTFGDLANFNPHLSTEFASRVKATWAQGAFGWSTDDWTWTTWTYTDGTRVLQEPTQKVHFIGVSLYYRWQ